MSAGKRLCFWTILVVSTFVVTIVGLELLVRALNPQAYIYPRYQYSERLSQALLPSTKMVAALPGEWRFVYTTSEYGFRAPTMAVSNHYDLPNVVVLGDSYSFGNGVDDGEEYPAVLAGLLRGRANVVNLGVPGYGLTQEIRLFYEFGQAYDPAIVVVQFSDNDPDDNLFYEVTVIQDGRFVFQADQSLGTFLQSIKNSLSASMIQRSQLYNFLRNAAYETLRKRHVEQELRADEDSRGKEEFHNELLDLLVRDLDARGIDVVFFGVTGHLGRFPHIAAKVQALSDEGLLSYLPSEPWFEGVTDYATPEGHAWGAKAHRIVAENVAPAVKAILAARERRERPERLSDASVPNF
jgi:GDSL-like Lipase/Acylhydrolase family